MKLGFIGLGIMGAPMAGHLLAAGHSLFVHTRSKVPEALAGATACASSREVAQRADVVFTMVPDTPDVEAVLFGETGVASGLTAGKTVVDMSSISPIETKAFAAKINALGCDYLDAPVSGGQAGAVNGVLTVMCGGDVETFAKAEPVMKAYAKAITLIGASGAGQLAKSVNQICIAGVVQGLAEGLHFARKNGLSEAKVIEAISAGAAQSWQMENRYKTMLADKFDFGFAVDWMRKDLGIAFAEAERIGARVDAARAVDALYAQLQRGGGGRRDTSSLVEALRG